MLQIPFEKYKAITSYSIYPEDEFVPLEVPDNWSWTKAYNVSLKNYIKIINSSLKSGYTLGLSTDITDPNFVKRLGVAYVPAGSKTTIKPEDRVGTWEDITNQKLGEMSKSKSEPGPEREITTDLRERGFSIYFVSDDQKAHIIGTAKDQYGKRYYKIKSSSEATGIKGKGGYVYMSESYMEYKTLSILVNIDALPKAISQSLLSKNNQ